MSYWKDYDWFEDQSEADQIIDETVEQLTGLISKKLKADIEEAQKKSETLSDRNAELQKENWELREQNDILKLDVKTIKEALERKDNEIPKVPFMPGDKIWWIGNDCRNRVEIKCPVCSGKGKVKTQTTDYGEVEIACPHCKGNRQVSYEPAKAYSGYVIRSLVYLDAQKSSPSFSYDIVQEEHEYNDYSNNEKGKNWYLFGRDKVYKTKEEADEMAKKETEERKSKAEKELLKS